MLDTTGPGRLYDYVCDNWYTHVQHVKEHDGIYELLETLFQRRYELLKSIKRNLPAITAEGTAGLSRLLRFAVVVGSPWIVTRIIRRSPNLINSEIGEDDTPLVLAVQHGHFDVTKILLDHGADVSLAPNSHTPLMHSVRQDQENVVELLLTRGADIDAHPEAYCLTAFHIAALHGHTNHTAALLHHGADPNVRDVRNRTPLHFAVLCAWLTVECWTARTC